jgi:arginine/ornithine transport system substrate-binding protein
MGMKNTIAAVLIALAGATSAVAQDLKVCVEGAYPPFSSTNESGEVVGFDIDIANALCEEMGVGCTMVKTDWDGIIPALLERKCDAIVASMSITEDRKKVIDFSNKYYLTPARFVTAKGSDFDVENLDGKVVGVQRGTIHHDFMEGEFPGVELKLYGTQDEVYLDLAAGRIDAFIADSVAALDGFLNTDAGQGFEFVGPAYSTPKYHGEGAGIGIRKGEDELKSKLNAAIDAIRANGKYEEINSKYFDFDIYGS